MLLVGLSHVARAQAGWVTIDSSVTRRTRINTDRLRSESATVVEAWTEMVFSGEQEPLIPAFARWTRRLEDSYFDCDRLQIMQLSTLYYTVGGAGAGSYTPPNVNRAWRPTAPGSLDEFIAKRACQLAGKGVTAPRAPRH